MPFLQSNNISVYYEIYGKGQPLILLSGLGGDHLFWQNSIAILATDFQVILLDTRGSGKTDAPEASYSIDLFADDLAGFMDALQLEKAHILGFSMGGLIAQAFALKYPEKILMLILAATYPVMNIQARLFLDAVLAVYEHGASAKQMFDLIAPWLFHPDFLNEEENKVFLEYDENEPDQQPFYAWKNQYVATREFNVTASLKKIIVPVLILTGADDRLAHPEDARLLAKHIPDARLKIIPCSGHLINYEQPELFHQNVLEFLIPD